MSAWRASKSGPARDALGTFPPEITVEIKAPACELPATLGLPLSRLSVADVARYAQHCGIVARISDSTVWRWLHEDAIRPCQHRCWIFPRDPQFQAKTRRILDLYARCWQGHPRRSQHLDRAHARPLGTWPAVETGSAKIRVKTSEMDYLENGGAPLKSARQPDANRSGDECPAFIVPQFVGGKAPLACSHCIGSDGRYACSLVIRLTGPG